MKGPDIQRIVFVALLSLLGVFMTTSVFMANLVWVLLAANWLVEGCMATWRVPRRDVSDATKRCGCWREKWQMARDSRLLHAVLALIGLLALSLLWSDNWQYGLYDLQKKLPLLTLPLVLLTTKPLEGHERHVVRFFYVGTVFVVTIISVVRMATMPGLPYRDIVPYISHIRFALNVCLAICILISLTMKAARSPHLGAGHRSALPTLHYAFIILLIVWFALFLLIIRSYTGIVVLAVAGTVVLACFQSRLGRLRWWFAGAWLCAVLGIGGLTAVYVHDYYSPVPLMQQPLAELTAGGRPYTHRQDGMVENGNRLNDYICNEEVCNEWPKRSDVPLNHRFDNGYELYPTLIRYLNAMGLTKDSVGVWSLTAAQVVDIERGVANPVYETFGPRRMVYVMLFERENYRHFGAVRDFTMLQRFELWKTAVRVIGDHPWLGVGDGDVPDELHARLEADDSPMAGTSKNPHCQYLTLTMAIGVIGVLIILVLLLRALLPGGRLARELRDPLMVAFVTIVLVSFCSEDTLDTLAGILFCCFYLSFRKSQPCTNTTNSATECE